MITRNFGVPDVEMFESGRTMRQLFLDHKAPFVAKDVSVDDPFAADWQTSIEASEGWETDEVRTDQQEQETADVLEQMEKGRAKHAEIFYYVDKAFADKPAIRKKFGSDDYAEASVSQARMITYLKNMHKQCEVPAQKAELLANDLVQAQIDDIETIYTALATKNTEQNTFIEESPEATQARVVQYNTTYGFAQKINRLSKVVYYGNPVMLNMFHLPEGAQPDPDINVKGKVTDAANGNPLKGVLVNIEVLGISTKTSFYGNYSFVSIPAGSYVVAFSLPGYTTVLKNITVLASGVVIENCVLAV